MAIRGSKQIRDLEARHGRPLARILVTALDDHGSVTEAAKSLGVNPKTFWGWMVRYHVRVERRAFVA